MLSRKGLLVLAVLASVAASCSSAVTPAPGPRTQPAVAVNACTGQTPPPASAPQAVRPRAAAKQPLHGLIDLGEVYASKMPEPPYNTIYYVCRKQAAMSGIVVNDTWSSLQPNGANTPIDTGTIDAALQRIAAYNQSPARSLGVRLRVWAGIDAPNWAKHIGGPPIEVCDGKAIPTASPSPADVLPAPASPTPCPAAGVRTLGAFWTTAYQNAWANVQMQLAKKYDGNPLVSEVSVSSCTSLTAEPFVQPEDSFSRNNLVQAGYTDARYRACLTNAIPNNYAPAWHNTIVDYSFNPFRRIQTTPPATDLAFTESVMVLCRKDLNARCALLNETLAKFTPPPSPRPGQTPSTEQNYYRMWRYMKSLGGEITFQTTAPPYLYSVWGSNQRGWNAAIRLAHEFGASSVELFAPKNTVPCIDPPERPWIEGYPCFSTATMLRWKSVIAGS